MTEVTWSEITHPSIKKKRLTAEAVKSAKQKLKQLVFEATTPLEESSYENLFDDFLQDEDNIFEKDLDEFDFFLNDKDEGIEKLNKYPQIKLIFMKYKIRIWQVLLWSAFLE